MGAFRHLAVGLLATLFLAACSSAPETGAPNKVETSDLFESVFYDYDVLKSGNELLAVSDLAVQATLTSIELGPSFYDPKTPTIREQNCILTFLVTKNLNPSKPVENEAVRILLPLTAELREAGVENSPIEGLTDSAVLYLTLIKEDPAWPLDAHMDQPLYVPVSPQGFIVDSPGPEVRLILEQGATVVGELADFYPSDAPLPERGSH